MRFELLKITNAPRLDQNQCIWVSERENQFYVADTWKVVCMEAGPNFDTRTIWETGNHNEAYQVKGLYDKRLPEILFEEIRAQGISGFKLLSKEMYDLIDAPVGPTSSLELVNRFGLVRGHLPLSGHFDRIFTFEGKSVSMAEMIGNTIEIISTVRMKGKVPIDVHLHPQLGIIVYVTNYGEVYAQYFSSKGFKKTIKVADLQKPCYQAGFTSDGRCLIVCGLGFVRTYQVGETGISEVSVVESAARSFVVLDNWLVLNKGLHGLDLFCIDEKMEAVASLEIPFSIDRMVLHRRKRMLLLTCNPFREIGFVRLVQ